jgi:signal transduction histidine kinase
MYTDIVEDTLKDMPCLLIRSGIVVDAEGPFLELTGYSPEETRGKSITAVFNELLRSGCDAGEAGDGQEAYIFTKTLDAVEVNIYIRQNRDSKRYYFSERAGRRLRDLFPAEYKLLDDNKIGIAIYTSPDFILLNANQKYLDVHDHPFNTREMSIGRRLEEIIPPSLVCSIMPQWKNIARANRTFYGKEVKGISGTWKDNYCDLTVIPVMLDSSPKFLIMMLEDVSEKVHTRLHLERQAEIIRQQKEQLEAIIENMSDALFMIDRNGRHSLLNHAAKELFRSLTGHTGDNPEDYFLKAGWFDLNGGELTFENTPAQRVLRGESFTELRLLARFGRGNYYLNISGAPICDVNGNYQMGILCCRDITEYLKSSKLLGIQKNQLEAIMDNVSEIIFILDTAGRIYYGNKVARSYCRDMKPEEMENMRSKTILTDFEGNVLDGDDLPNNKAMSTKEAVHSRLIARVDDIELYLELVAVPILDDNGSIVFIMVSACDITDHIKNEMLMQKKNDMLEQSLHLKDEFLSLISHEFKTPLTVINAAIQALELLCRDELSEKARSFINKIRQNSFRQIRLVNNILDITRINAGHLKINKKNSDIVFLTRSITESVRLYAAQKDLSLRFTTDLDRKIIGLDEEKYERILLNLLSNAIKFSQRGKTILVEIRLSEGTVLVDVSDEGIGIPADKLDIIFERFGQVDSSLSRQAEGTGIGLSLVKLFVEDLGGNISVKSTVGVGSTFSVSLPDKPAAEEYIETSLKEFTDNRITQAIVIEFSDIYL